MSIKNDIQSKVRFDLDQQQREYFLHQQMKTIQEELGGNSSEEEIEELRTRAKNKKWNKDFWNDLVGPTLKTNINVESWIRGKIPPILDSDGIHKTFDIKYIDLRPLGFPWVWSETHDHTKWGISVDSDWVCIGDMNRMVSQRKRGGGTIAFQDPTL